MTSHELLPRIACVIVTFNRYAELVKTISAVAREGIPANDVIVVNNNSSDGTAEKIRVEFPDVSIINLSQNIASAGGFAKGMEQAHRKNYNWVWLFNDDSRPKLGTLLSVSKYFSEAEEKNIGLIKVSNQDEKGRAVLLYWNGARQPVYVDVADKLIATDLITFDGCLISGKLMDAIGYCDPQYFMGTYEFDYCLKAKDAGFGIYTLANGMVEDGKLGSAKGTPPWRQYYNTRNHLWLALNRKSFKILKGWTIKELKYTYGILRYSKTKGESLLFKLRAVRDAILNRRGKRYDPERYKS